MSGFSYYCNDQTKSIKLKTEADSTANDTYNSECQWNDKDWNLKPDDFGCVCKMKLV